MCLRPFFTRVSFFYSSLFHSLSLSSVSFPARSHSCCECGNLCKVSGVIRDVLMDALVSEFSAEVMWLFSRECDMCVCVCECGERKWCLTLIYSRVSNVSFCVHRDAVSRSNACVTPLAEWATHFWTSFHPSTGSRQPGRTHISHSNRFNRFISHRVINDGRRIVNFIYFL